MAELVRLQRFLSAAGVAARRKCEQLITSGHVSVNGKAAMILGTKVDPDRDIVTVDGQAVAVLDRFYVLLNKPKGCITAVSDDRGRPTVMDYLPNCPVPVKPVGRLDFYSEGVLLLTNDGELASRLLAPARHVPKTYHAKVHGRVSNDDLKALRLGIQLEDGTFTQPAEVALLPSDSKYSWVGITIYEGKHRQIHRMLEALGFRVDKLQRVAFANLTFHHLRVGDARELTQQELNALRDAVGLDHSAVARGRWKATREATDIPRRARAKARAEAAVSSPHAGDEAGVGHERSSSQGFPRVISRQEPPQDRSRQGPPRVSSRNGPPRGSSRQGPPRVSSRNGPPRFSSRQGPPRGAGTRSPVGEFQRSSGPSQGRRTLVKGAQRPIDPTPHSLGGSAAHPGDPGDPWKSLTREKSLTTSRTDGPRVGVRDDARVPTASASRGTRDTAGVSDKRRIGGRDDDARFAPARASSGTSRDRGKPSPRDNAQGRAKRGQGRRLGGRIAPGKSRR